MSTPDQPSTPPLTRRQLRELRNTASTPIITPEQAQADAEMSDAAAEEAAEAAAAHEAEVAPERTPVALDDLSDLDPDAQPVTRRQARLLEKLRTGTVDVVAVDTDGIPTPESEEAEAAVAADEPIDADEVDDEQGDTPDAVGTADVDPAAEEEPAAVEDGAVIVEDESPAEAEAEDSAVAADSATMEHEGPEAHEESEEPEAQGEPEPEEPEAHEEEDEPARVVAPDLGAQLLEDGAAHVDLPPSFDHLLTRGGSGSASAPNALILSQTPDTGSLSVPMLGTGELIITGSYQLPDTFGSTGAAPGVSDGKDADAALIDGELPPASSPTPIAASSAISTIKSADEIIRPPAPEKGSRLVMTLAILAGALGLALATALVLTLVNGNF
ncbi:hypothetical protein ACIGEP_05935 [Microbacterium sp. NPDC077663]|uniref:hypothetical protein n=1 Tax=Microbacterium sp. NPDC077663 TaxID=3364189 RepID=UPI0037C92AC7